MTKGLTPFEASPSVYVRPLSDQRKHEETHHEDEAFVPPHQAKMEVIVGTCPLLELIASEARILLSSLFSAHS